ncbi:hypothetical protein COTS27_01035 [Spirochaetota bacterium]|nr:hypothetical protein COTS27_01035 [Spirochaetota bacterium]
MMIRFNSILLVGIVITTILSYLVASNLALVIIGAMLSGIILILNFLLELLVPKTKQISKRMKTLEAELLHIKRTLSLKNWEE